MKILLSVQKTILAPMEGASQHLKRPLRRIRIQLLLTPLLKADLPLGQSAGKPVSAALSGMMT